jgi:hypothetical protein
MKKLVLAIALIPTLAFAQAQSPPTQEQMLGATIGNLFVENARLAAELQKAQATIQALQKEHLQKPDDKKEGQ